MRNEQLIISNEQLAINNERITNKVKSVLLILLITICYLLTTNSLFAVDFGVVLDQEAEYTSTGDDTAFAYTGVIIPRVTGLIGDSGEFYVSAGLNFENDPWSFIPELLRTDFNWRTDAIALTAGRMSYDDPLGYIASGLFDGARATFETGMGNFSAGAWYTGLIYKKRVNIEMTENEYAANNTELDYADFANSYFAPRRVLAAVDWEHNGLWDLAIARLSLLSQFDLTEEKLHSQYLAGKMIIPYKAFTFNLGGCFELVEADKETGKAFALEAACEWRSDIHYLSLGAKYASGENGSLSAFLPLTTNTQGYVLEPKLSGLAMFSLDYTARLFETFSAGVYPVYYILTSSTEEKRRLGGEIYAAAFWSPLPDISASFGLGAFMPSLGNVEPDEKATLRVELKVVIALY